MKELKKLNGVKKISKTAQKEVVGGCPTHGGGSSGCPHGMCGQIIFPGPDFLCVEC